MGKPKHPDLFPAPEPGPDDIISKAMSFDPVAKAIAAWNSRPDAERAEGSDVETIKRDAYKQGWSDCEDGFIFSVDQIAPPPPIPSSTGGEGATVRLPRSALDVIEAARNMPRRTPAPGGCGTAHTFSIEAGAVWVLDRSLTDFDADSAVYNLPSASSTMGDVALSEALKGFDDDFMTSETHHPGYVLIPTAKFDAIRSALSRPQPVAETVEAREFIENWFAPWGSWKTAWWEMAVSDDVEMTDANALKALRKILAALRPSAHGEAG